MRKNLYKTVIALTGIFLSFTSFNSKAQSSSVSDTVIMGPSYANEIYYSMSVGQVLSVPRNTWDIAFRTMKRSSSILTNDGSNVVLYTYPKSDTSGWASIDTSGITSWAKMYNDPNDWENGAFSRNQKGYPDYGWAIYNTVTHDLIGDSLFIIKLRDGSFRKLWIQNKRSVQDIYHFRYANLDGTGEHIDTLDLSNDIATDFIGFSLENNQKVSFQPVIADWDIVFTKYMSVQPDGSPYPATTVLLNSVSKAKKFHPVPLTYTNWGINPWDSTRSAIGWDWKSFNMTTFTYEVVDSMVFFVKPASGDVYKLYFTGFAGSSTGLVSFVKEKVSSNGTADIPENTPGLTVYPNPVNNILNLLLNSSSEGYTTIVLSDLSGRQLGADHPVRLVQGPNMVSLDVSGYNPGLYVVSAISAGTKSVAKVIISR